MAPTLPPPQVAAQDTLRYYQRVAPRHEHRTNVVTRVVELHSNLGHLDGKLANADTSCVSAEEPTP